MSGRAAWAVAILTLALFFIPGAAKAQKTPVRVSITANDSIGQRLGYALKEAIRQSSSVQLVERNEDSRFVVYFATINEPWAAERNFTAYSAVITFRPDGDASAVMYRQSEVAICSGEKEKIQACAERLVAFLDEHVSEWRRFVADKLSTQQKEKRR